MPAEALLEPRVTSPNLHMPPSRPAGWWARRKQIVAPFLLLVAALATYAPALRNGFVWDDQALVSARSADSQLAPDLGGVSALSVHGRGGVRLLPAAATAELHARLRGLLCFADGISSRQHSVACGGGDRVVLFRRGISWLVQNGIHAALRGRFPDRARLAASSGAERGGGLRRGSR